MRGVLFAATLLTAGGAAAQEQQAGGEGTENPAETFESLVAQCDDTDALAMRARIRLLLGRTTDEARRQAETLLEEGLAACGEGDLDGAMATLEEARQVADAGTDEVFGATDEAEPQEAAAVDAQEDGQEDGQDRPWWKFW